MNSDHILSIFLFRLPDRRQNPSFKIRFLYFPFTNQRFTEEFFNIHGFTDQISQIHVSHFFKFTDIVLNEGGVHARGGGGGWGGEVRVPSN